MKTKSNIAFVMAIILLSITSVYPLNTETSKKVIPTKEKNSFWANHQLNWKNTNKFNSYWNKEETTTFNDRTVTISNKKVATSKDDSYQDNKGNNKPTNYESGNIRWKGYRFQNLNIPPNATITNVELILTGYKHGKTTVNIKAEKVKSPTSYSSDKNYLSTRSTTSKSINWYIPKLSNGTQIKSPNLKDVVQEVVNSKGGIQNLSLIISSSTKWECWNFDDKSSSYYPRINISYTLSNPDIADDKHTMNENTVATIAVFNNDSNVPSSGSVKISTSPKNGTVKITDPNNTPTNPSDDVFTYTPKTNFDGTDTFKYSVCDSSNNCDTASVNVTINSVVDPCDAAASGNLDTDNDGISDVCDLDDDNDGILDTDECPTVNPFSFKLNANNKKFTNSGLSGDVGDVMLYKNVGTHLGSKIDLKITVTANSDPQNMSIDISGFKYGNDLYPVLLDGKNTKEIPYATVKFEFVKNGTNQLVNVAPSFMFKDIDFLNDGTGESVEINKNLVSSYSLSKNPATSLYIVDNIATNYVGTSGSFLRVNSKKEAGGLNNEDMWIGLQLSEVNSFNINFLKRTGNTGYVFESDTFSKSANTVQLDADCSLDSDADGIPDYLDTDSDNDGCPDATEAEKNVQTTATLTGGSNGGSSANLGVKVNKNGIPIPFGTTNGNETKGQKITNATKTAEKITIATTDLTIKGEIKKDITLKIDAIATKTNTFNNGEPNYDNPNGTDTSSEITYKWYKKSNPTKVLSTKKTYDIYYSKSSDAGDYIIVLTGANSSCSKEVTLTLNINDTPSANKDFGNVQEDSVDNKIDVLKNDDFGGDGPNTGKITLVSGKSENGGTVSVDDNGTPNNPKDDKLLFTPFANFNGRDIFKYTITDANGDSSTAEVSIFVNSVNDLPTAKADTFTLNENSPETKINVTENDDFGGDGPNKGKIAVYNRVSKQKGSVNVDDNGTPKDPTDDKILYKPAENFNGIDEFTYVIIDANGNRSDAKVTVNVTSVNSLPTATADTVTLEEDSSSNHIDVLDNDDFGGDGASSGTIILATATSTKGGTIKVNDNNTPNNPTDDAITYTPLADFNGEDTFEYSIKDADGEIATATVTVTVTAVNDKPTATKDTVTVDEDSINNSFDVLANDSFGGDGASTGTISISSGNSDKGGTIVINDNGTTTDPTDDKITYTPTANFNGSDSFEYTITDADGDTSTGKVSITVNSINDLPSAVADTATVDEDSSDNAINVLTNDSFGGDGPNAGTIILENETSSKGGTIKVNNNNTSSDPTDDTILYSPAENFNGTDTFNYSIIDKNGDVSSAKITVTVNSINDVPTAITDAVSVDEDSSNNSINVTENDNFGGDGASTGTISIASATTIQNGTISIDDNGTATDPTDDKIIYAPLANFQGMDSFTYTITDANGDTATATVNVNVNSVNDVPSATADTATVDEDASSTSINVTANDNFGGDGASSGTISIDSATSENGGTIAVDDNGTATDPTDDKITYTPAENFNGTDTISYSIADANGDISKASVTITVNSVNDLPAASADIATVEEDSNKNYINVLDNDSFGGDGANTSTITLVAATSNQGGVLTVNNNSTPNNPSDDAILYTPSENYNGQDTFQYTITDANGDTSTATVTVTVNAVNDNPTATADSVSVDEDSTNNSFDILANDSFGGDGPNSGTISISSGNSDKGGTISVDDNGTANDPTDDKITYNPAANYNGTDSFEYTITDANGDTATQTVKITVNAVNDLPTAEDDTITIDEDTASVKIPVLSNDSYGGDGYLVRARTIIDLTGTKGTAKANSNGTRSDPTDDVIIYSPPANFNGVDTFKYTIIDANGDKATAKVIVTVNAVNDNPTATADAITVDEDSNNNSIKVTNNDDFGGDGPSSGTISIASGNSDNGGTISVDDNGCGILYNEDIGFAVMVDGVPHKNLSATQSVQLYLDYLNSQGS